MKSDRTPLRAAALLSLGSVLCLSALLAAFAPGAARAAAGAAATPAQVQFGGQCAEGLAEGQHVTTNCSITWTDKDGKTYCFSNDGRQEVTSWRIRARICRRRAISWPPAAPSRPRRRMQAFDSNDAEAVVKKLIESTSQANNGVFPLEDPLNGAQLKLTFDGIDFTRTIDGYGFFPDVKFHDQADAQKHYLIDFWVIPAQGALKVQEIRIYKEPLLSEGTWTLIARQPSPGGGYPPPSTPDTWPTSAAGKSCRRSNRTRSPRAAKNNGVFKLKDDKTGKELNLEFIDTHQPIRQLDENGHYFACTDFRVVGTKDQIYDIDFWVTDKDGTMTVEQTKVHKVPELKDGQWIQVPRYEWKDRRRLARRALSAQRRRRN